MRFTSLRSCLTVLALLGPLANQDGVLLRLKWHAGDVLRYRMTMEQTVEMSMLPEMAMENTSAGVIREEVEEIAADGTASIEFSYEAMRMEMQIGTETRSFDSTLKGDDANQNDADLEEMFQPLLETKLHMKQAPNGHVSEITGARELLTKLMESASNDGTAQFIEGMLSDDSLRRLLEVSVYPDGALKPGDTWKRDYEQALPPIGTMKFVVDNEFTGQETRGGNPCAKIAMVTKISITSDEDAQFRMRMEPEASKAKGTMWFDVEHGRLVEFTQVMEMKMEMGSESEEDAEESHSMEITTNMAMTMLLLGKDAPAFEPAPKSK